MKFIRNVVLNASLQRLSDIASKPGGPALSATGPADAKSVRTLGPRNVFRVKKVSTCLFGLFCLATLKVIARTTFSFLVTITPHQ